MSKQIHIDAYLPLPNGCWLKQNNRSVLIIHDRKNTILLSGLIESRSTIFSRIPIVRSYFVIFSYLFFYPKQIQKLIGLHLPSLPKKRKLFNYLPSFNNFFWFLTLIAIIFTINDIVADKFVATFCNAILILLLLPVIFGRDHFSEMKKWHGAIHKNISCNSPCFLQSIINTFIFGTFFTLPIQYRSPNTITFLICNLIVFSVLFEFFYFNKISFLPTEYLLISKPDHETDCLVKEGVNQLIDDDQINILSK